MSAAPIVLVSGGKGGVGKTTLSANLATHLASRGLRVLLVDLDLGLANLDVLLGLDPRLTSEDALAGRCELRECVVTGAAGVHVLPAASGVAQLANLDSAALERLSRELERLARDYDLVIADSPAGIGADVLHFGARARLVLVVTTPDPAALSDAYGLIKALHLHAEEREVDLATPELVLNCVNGVDEARELARQLACVCERFLTREPRLAGWLPRSTRIQQSCRRRTLFSQTGQRGLELHCLGELARRVAQLIPRPSALVGAAQG